MPEKMLMEKFLILSLEGETFKHLLTWVNRDEGIFKMFWQHKFLELEGSFPSLQRIITVLKISLFNVKIKNCHRLHFHHLFVEFILALLKFSTIIAVNEIFVNC
ncbi:hypothetical protein HNY73_015374 [Argiope bruennichi]|uniref:Uncharacterized protein n=1 Tax=Argiope bruennichi TaxID=94029 RepID=A0A8T0ERU8_ARGBR|nr:hypothetical protein HNY73_015374 [Argiope bruennichi]